MIPVYQGVPRQQGYGLGSVFKSAMKTVTPFLKPVVESSLESLKIVESLRADFRPDRKMLGEGTKFCTLII